MRNREVWKRMSRARKRVKVKDKEEEETGWETYRVQQRE